MNNFILKNKQGMQVTLLEYGARVSSILFPVDNKLTEMTLGYHQLPSYRQDSFYLGATVGRVCNRIAQGRFTLNNQTYQLSQNSDQHCLHGGKEGFSSRIWQVNKESLSTSFVEFSLFSEDGEQGFPGALVAKVAYSLSADNRLTIQFSATSDQDTLVNMCNHCYFHLGEESIGELTVQINAKSFLATDKTNIPLPHESALDNSDFNFSQPANVLSRITSSSDEQILRNKGFDHCYILDEDVKQLKKPCAVLTGLSTNVQLKVFTDQIGLQLYTGQYLSEEFRPYQALCLEAQGIPDAINSPLRTSAILKRKEQYQKQVSYQFSVARR